MTTGSTAVETSKHRGFSVHIFVPSGEPEGLRIVEKSNWTGQGFVFPRALFPEVRTRAELQRVGVYVLWGPGEGNRLTSVYVGQSDGVDARLAQHIHGKEFWTQAVVFTNKDRNLNRAHAQYLEARLIGTASEAKRCDLKNGNAPQLPDLSEADTVDAESFLADILLCLPMVGVSFFEVVAVAPPAGRELRLKAKGIEARGVDDAEGFVVRKESHAVKTTTRSIPPYLKTLREDLLGNGVLADDGSAWRLTQDYVFGSPSQAAGVLLGRSSNGRMEWRDARGRSLKALQESELGAE